MAGRPEILTEELAEKISRMIEKFPDSEIPVTWENIIAHCKKRFGYGGNRQLLAQKEWDGRKLIAEAFTDAKSVQRRMLKDSRPKYQNSSRAILQKRIGELEAKILALQDELENIRAQQMSELDVFLNTPRDLRQMFERYANAPQDDELAQKRNARKQANERKPDEHD